MQDLSFPILYLLRELLISNPNDDKLKNIFYLFIKKYFDSNIEKEKATKEIAINQTNNYRNFNTLPLEKFDEIEE